MRISEKLQLIKKFTGLTQEKIAQELGVSFVTLNSWLNKRSIPHKKKQEKIDELYKKVTGESVISDDLLSAKKNLIINKSKKYKNIITHILNREDLLNEFILQLTYNSNSIEGSTLTENDTEAILFRNENIKNKSLIEHFEVKNHQAAMKYLFTKIEIGAKLKEELILKLHAILMNGIRDDAGFYRRHGVRIVGANVPTANFIRVPELMRDLINEINKLTKDYLGQIAVIHSKFEKIHPFSDGNGRVGRLIVLFMLLKNNIAPAVIKQKNKNLYYKFLQKSQIHNDYSLLEDFICDAVLEGYKIVEE